MRRLRIGTPVLVEARDWMSDSSWHGPTEGNDPAPLGWIRGIVVSQDDTTLILASSGFYDSPEKDRHKIPIGCIEAVYETVEKRQVLWHRKRKEK